MGGRETRRLVSHVDLLPTVLDALGLEIPAAAQGRSLGPLLEKGEDVDEYVYSALRAGASGKDLGERPLHV